MKSEIIYGKIFLLFFFMESVVYLFAFFTWYAGPMKAPTTTMDTSTTTPSTDTSTGNDTGSSGSGYGGY